MLFYGWGGEGAVEWEKSGKKKESSSWLGAGGLERVCVRRRTSSSRLVGWPRKSECGKRRLEEKRRKIAKCSWQAVRGKGKRKKERLGKGKERGHRFMTKDSASNLVV
jgi:hypothetical protein